MLHQQWEREAGGVAMVAVHYHAGGREGGRDEAGRRSPSEVR